MTTRAELSDEECAAIRQRVLGRYQVYTSPRDGDDMIRAGYAAGLAAREPVADYAGLARALRIQRQVDEDGTECGVSRQAVDEAASIIERIAAPPAAPVPVAAQEPVAWLDHKGRIVLPDAYYNSTISFVAEGRAIPNQWTPLYAAPPAAPDNEREREIAEAKGLVLDCTGSACLSGERQSPTTRQADLKAIRDKLLTVLGLLTREAAPVEPPAPAAVEALRELVAVQDLKRAIFSEWDNSVGHEARKDTTAMMHDHTRRHDAAWAAARAVLQSLPKEG